MNDKDKINLTDLNKQKKSFTSPKLKNPFKKQTGPNRDDVGKFATTAGGGGLKSIKKFNWKRATPLIAIVTLVGGFLVFQSFAAGPSVPGRENCRTWGKANGVPVEYFSAGAKSNANQDFVKREYLSAFGVLPTFEPWDSSEYKYWFDRAAELHSEYSGDKWRQACGITYQLHKEIIATTPAGLDARLADAANKGEDVLKTIYAEQIKPRGMMSNPYLEPSIYTEFATLPIKPNLSSISEKWDAGWTDKIKVCAILYNKRPGISGMGIEHTVTINVMATGNYKKSLVLEKQPTLESKLYPKYEVCSNPIPKIYKSPAAPGRPAYTAGTNTGFSAGLDMVSIVRKDPKKPNLPAKVLKQYKWDTSPNDYYVRVEQYQIKKAE